MATDVLQVESTLEVIGGNMSAAKFRGKERARLKRLQSDLLWIAERDAAMATRSPRSRHSTTTIVPATNTTLTTAHTTMAARVAECLALS